MKKTINLEGKEVDYTFRRYKRQKYMRLTIHSDASLLVTAPRWALNVEIDSFIRKQSSWILKQMQNIRDTAGKEFVWGKGSYSETKELARKIVTERLELYNRIYGFTWNRISIRNQKTVWGSCSSTMSLSFNYKLALLPQKLADYVIVHELCHLKEMNHSKLFWDLVAKAVPDHKQCRRELRKNGLYLN